MLYEYRYAIFNGRQPPKQCGNPTASPAKEPPEKKKSPGSVKRSQKVACNGLTIGLKATCRLMDGNTPERALALRCAQWSI